VSLISITYKNIKKSSEFGQSYLSLDCLCKVVIDLLLLADGILVLLNLLKLNYLLNGLLLQ